MTVIPDPNLFVLDTLGKLHMHRHGIGGYCLVCQRLFAVSIAAPAHVCELPLTQMVV